MTAASRDLFSEQASTYSQARPTYPDALYRAVAQACARRQLAWDCATGNGQAARDLARYFGRVVATDLSARQIAHRVSIPNVTYHVAAAEASALADASLDLVTIAQALHWLDHPGFYAEVERVLRPDGVIAAWSYGSCSVSPTVDAELRAFEHGIVGPYWPPNRRWVDEGYRTIPFPFAEIPMPSFELRVNWTLGELGEYLRSWSAVTLYRRDRGSDPVAPLLHRLQHHWEAGAPDRRREVVWPLNLRVGRGRVA